MRELRPRDPEAMATVEGVVAQIRDEWLREPNIEAIGPAIKLVGGIPQVDKLCIRFFVAEKLSPDELSERGWREVPTEIEDIPTDVSAIAQAPMQLLATRTRRFDPLLGGIGIGNVNRNVVGTLGAVVFHNDDGRAVGLTNEHVLIETNLGAVGDPVDQPDSGSAAVVQIVEADCCPGGQLTTRDIPNPVRDVALSVAAAAFIAMGLSDEIDPHRRGQEATPVADGERTLRERVRMSMRSPDFPLPGTPYQAEVDWTYERHTDQRTHTYSVSERRTNPHVLAEQWLVTDRPRYILGDEVHYLGAIVSGAPERRCPPFHVVAHAVAPSAGVARRTIVRPVLDADREVLARLFPEPRVARKCVSFRRFHIGQSLGSERVLERFRFRPLDQRRLRVLDAVPGTVEDGVAKLLVTGEGIEVVFPHPVHEVAADVAAPDGSALTLRGFDGTTEIASETQPGQGSPFTLGVTAARITSAHLEGHGVLVRLCVGHRISDEACLYWGSRRLSPQEETGTWPVFLVVQTVNDVALGIDAVHAARTIGGLATSNNLTSGDRIRTLSYGSGCAIDAVADTDLEVDAPPSGHSP
jgi:hypothetical protein